MRYSGQLRRCRGGLRSPLYAAGGLSQVRRQDGRVAFTPCSDLSPASWILASDRPWQQLVGFGPAGFSAHARLRFLRSSTGQGAPFERGPRLRRHSRPRCCAGRRLSYRTAPTTCSAGRCQSSATGAQLRCGQEDFDSTCPIPPSSGRPTMPGVSPMTSTHTGPGSELTSRSSTSFWLIRNSTSSRPTRGPAFLPIDHGRAKSCYRN
jgi:hypothetical protein